MITGFIVLCVVVFVCLALAATMRSSQLSQMEERCNQD